MLLSAASKRRFLGAQLFLTFAQSGGSLLDHPLEAAIEPIQLLDHQRDRTIGAPTVLVGLLVGAGNQLGEQLEADLAGFFAGLGKLSCDELMHVSYPRLSEIVVTVIV